MTANALDLVSYADSVTDKGFSVTRFSSMTRARAAVMEAKKTLSGMGPREGEPEPEVLELVRTGTLKVFLQAKWNPKNGDVAGFEALCRMRTPLGLLSPGRFIPFLADDEREALEWDVLRAVFKLVGEAPEEFFLRKMRIGVNVSPGTLGKDGFAERLKALADEAGASLGAIKIEILEDRPILEREKLSSQAELCRKLGAHVSLDDFCAGNSSPRDLSEFSVDEVKIDKDLSSLLHDKKFSGRAGEMIRGIVVWAHGKGAIVTAEGVETEEMAGELSSLGVDLMQGYAKGVPVPAEEALMAIPKRYPNRPAKRR